MKTGFFAFVAALCVLAVYSFTAMAADKHDHSHAKLEIGSPAPAFTLKDQTGKDVSLKDYAGKIVVLEWFNDGCPFVVKHYKEGHMNKVASKYVADGVVWLRINSTDGTTPESNAKVAGKWNMAGPILIDANGEVGHEYAATNTPHMYVINKEGKLAYRGAIDSDSSADTAKVDAATNYVSKALDELLADKSVSQPETKAYGCTIKYASK